MADFLPYLNQTERHNKAMNRNMDLFQTEGNGDDSILPFDGWVSYYGKVFSAHDAKQSLDWLAHEIQWQQDEALIYGKLIQTKRKVAWYGDRDFAYTYSKRTKYALPWTEKLLLLKSRVEEITGEHFNSCLLNLYHNGSEGMAWHSDAEKDLKKHGAIASLSFGAERRFAFKHKVSGQKFALILEHGSLLLMKGTTQEHWLHRLPPVKGIHIPRINLTFRTIAD